MQKKKKKSSEMPEKELRQPGLSLLKKPGITVKLRQLAGLANHSTFKLWGPGRAVKQKQEREMEEKGGDRAEEKYPISIIAGAPFP